jgi:shikimate dehydrogenase
MPPPNITGRTRIIAHLGVPTESFASPMIYNPWFRTAGVDAVVVPMGCEAEDYPDFLRLLFRLRNIAGALVTMPHKTTTAGLVDVATAAVRVCGACNAVRRDAEGQLLGDMFDGEGFVRGVRSKGRTPRGTSAHIVGAGGVGSAIAASLAAAGAARLSLFDTEGGRAEALAARLSAEYPDLTVETGCTDPSGAGIVVNASPLGMSPGDPLPLDTARIDPGALVGDVVLSTEVTPFLAAARARGCQIQIGKDMLFEQIPAYLEFFGLPSTDAAELRTLAEFED